MKPDLADALLAFMEAGEKAAAAEPGRFVGSSLLAALLLVLLHSMQLASG